MTIDRFGLILFLGVLAAALGAVALGNDDLAAILGAAAAGLLGTQPIKFGAKK